MHNSSGRFRYFSGYVCSCLRLLTFVLKHLLLFFEILDLNFKLVCICKVTRSRWLNFSATCLLPSPYVPTTNAYLKTNSRTLAFHAQNHGQVAHPTNHPLTHAPLRTPFPQPTHPKPRCFCFRLLDFKNSLV